MSRNVKLAFMGVGGLALLYSCAPAVGAIGAAPLIWGMSNPFYRPPIAQNCGPAVPGAPACPPNQTSSSSTSSGGGSGSYHGSSRSSSTASSSSSEGSSSAHSSSSRGGFGSGASSHGASGSS